MSGFLGVDYFGDDVGLGNSPAPEQRPQSAPTFGGRITYIPLQIGGAIHLDLGVEGELAFTPSWTGYGFDGPRPSVFAPVLGYHANVLVRLGGGWLQPHLTAGGGGNSVLASSMFMAREADPVFLWGVGASFPMGDRWQLRMDARQGLMEAQGGGTTQTYEAHVAIGARLGVTPTVRSAAREVAVQAPPPTPPKPRDSDGDGLLDPDDRCPARPEDRNGFEDEDGCPEPDSDGDGIVDGLDRCPLRGEDMDGFEDSDGCDDPDNDGDEVVDGRDRCPTEAETKNGITDDDGCPDTLPASFFTALQSASGVTFERNRARLSRAAKAALDPALVALLDNPRLPVKIVVTAHPDKAGDKAAELAKKRADVVMWYLTERGVAATKLTSAVGSVVTDRKAPLIELVVAP